jgi:hypothetical protein
MNEESLQTFKETRKTRIENLVGQYIMFFKVKKIKTKKGIGYIVPGNAIDLLAKEIWRQLSSVNKSNLVLSSKGEKDGNYWLLWRELGDDEINFALEREESLNKWQTYLNTILNSSKKMDEIDCIELRFERNGEEPSRADVLRWFAEHWELGIDYLEFGKEIFPEECKLQ